MQAVSGLAHHQRRFWRIATYGIQPDVDVLGDESFTLSGASQRADGVVRVIAYERRLISQHAHVMAMIRTGSPEAYPERFKNLMSEITSSEG